MRGTSTGWMIGIVAVAALAAGCGRGARATGTTANTAAGSGAMVAKLYQVNPDTGVVNTRQPMGEVRFLPAANGVQVVAELSNVPVGGAEAMQTADGQGVFYAHGLHIHAGSACGPETVNGKVVAAGAAGGHLDPASTGKHLGPNGMGHVGDLPNVNVRNDGRGQFITTTNRFTLEQIAGRAVVLHSSPDNYTDKPANGGSGARIGCGVIEAAR